MAMLPRRPSHTRLTRHQVPRGARADAESDQAIYLFKRVPVLHATYQVRLLAYVADQQGKRLVLRVPKDFEAGPSLRALMEETDGLIQVDRV
jgi:hypothetical protein